MVASGGTPGDLNCDGVVNTGDLAPMVLALVDLPAYAAAFPSCDPANGDFTGDGVVSGPDISGFVGLLTGP